MSSEIETKELSTVRQQASKALNAATEMTIETTEDMQKASDVLGKIKSVGKIIKERKEAITRPMMESLNSVRDLFKPIESNHAEAERIIKSKMLDWQRQEDARLEKERLAIAKRVERGTMKPETAVAKMEKLPDSPSAVQGKTGAVAFRTIKRYRIVDETKIPREYLMPDMGKIQEALKAGKTVAGAESYEEKVVASSTALSADHALLRQK